MNASAVTYPKGLYNPAGINDVYYAFVEDIATFPTLADPATATTFDSLVSFADAITMKTGKKFNPVYCTLETGQIKSTLVGPRDGKGFEKSLEISFPGNQAAMIGFRAYAAGRDLVFIVREKNGVLRVVGDLEDPAFLETDEEGSGQKISDGRKAILTFKANGATPAPIYVTAITALLVAAS